MNYPKLRRYIHSEVSWSFDEECSENFFLLAEAVYGCRERAVYYGVCDVINIHEGEAGGRETYVVWR